MSAERLKGGLDFYNSRFYTKDEFLWLADSLLLAAAHEKSEEYKEHLKRYIEWVERVSSDALIAFCYSDEGIPAPYLVLGREI